MTISPIKNGRNSFFIWYKKSAGGCVMPVQASLITCTVKSFISLVVYLYFYVFWMINKYKYIYFIMNVQNLQIFIENIYDQCMTKPTIRPVWPANSDQPVSPPSKAMVLIYPSLDSLEAAEGTCHHWRLWSDCMDVQADLSLRWSCKSYCRFCRGLAHIMFLTQ